MAASAPQACELIDACRLLCTQRKAKHRVHRRGAFIALCYWVSHGGGQPKLRNLENMPVDALMLEELNSHPFLKHVAGFRQVRSHETPHSTPDNVLGVMATCTLKLFQHYVEKLGQLYTRDPTVTRVIPNTIFSVTSYNLGPRTACFKHIDFAHLPFGLCSITDLGFYDPSKGGIEFPPSATILIVSGIVAHSNVPVQTHETHYSVVHYSPGTLFRRVDNDFRRSVDFVASLSEGALAVQERQSSRREMY